MNLKTSLLAEAAWVLVEVAMMLAAVFGSPQVAKSQATPGPEAAMGLVNWPRTPWFKDADVLNYIELTPQRYNRLSVIYDRNWTIYNEARAKLDADELADEERAARRAELNRRFHEDLNAAVDEVYENRDARRRYDRLYHQYLGYGAFDLPEIRKTLNLTPEQLRKFNDLERAWNEDLQDLGETYRDDREAGRRRLAEMRREMRKNIDETLDEKQRQTWHDSIGDPYEFSPDTYFPETRD